MEGGSITPRDTIFVSRGTPARGTIPFVQVRPGRLHSLFPETRAGRAFAANQVAPREDAALIAGVLARDPDALAELHERFAQPVLRILMRVLGPDHELGDLHHDVFVPNKIELNTVHNLKK